VRNTKAPQRCGAFFAQGFPVIALGSCRSKGQQRYNDLMAGRPIQLDDGQRVAIK